MANDDKPKGPGRITPGKQTLRRRDFVKRFVPKVPGLPAAKAMLARPDNKQNAASSTFTINGQTVTAAYVRERFETIGDMLLKLDPKDFEKHAADARALAEQVPESAQLPPDVSSMRRYALGAAEQSQFSTHIASIGAKLATDPGSNDSVQRLTLLRGVLYARAGDVVAASRDLRRVITLAEGSRKVRAVRYLFQLLPRADVSLRRELEELRETLRRGATDPKLIEALSI